MSTLSMLRSINISISYVWGKNNGLWFVIMPVEIYLLKIIRKLGKHKGDENVFKWCKELKPAIPLFVCHYDAVSPLPDESFFCKASNQLHDAQPCNPSTKGYVRF